MTPKKLLIILFVLTIIIVAAAALYIRSVTAYGLPSIEQLENPRQEFATQVISSNGELLDMFSVEKRIYVPIDSIPQDFINALIATEDRQFYDHWGIHTARVFKAAIKNVLAGGIKEGASTITMQLARSLFLTRKVTVGRKIQEAALAIKLEETFTKNEILEMYANTVCFGRGAYGIQVASEIYFNKSPMELTAAECAFLVGILKNPTKYNGMLDYEMAIGRRNLVLTLMRDQDYLTYDEWDKATEEPLQFAQKDAPIYRRFFSAPHFVEKIRQNLSDRRLQGKDLYRDGLLIYTTLNTKIQRYANQAVKEHLSKLQKTFDRAWNWRYKKNLLKDLISEAIHKRADYISTDKKKKKQLEKKLKKDKDFIDSIKNAATTIQCGLVAIDPKTGAILAMVGASPKFMKEHADAKYSLNHVSQIKRQPGSSFKPIVYACAFEEGRTPESKVSREPFEYIDPYTGEVWRPKGMGKNIEADTVTFYRALVSSINTATARVITEYTNPRRVASTAHRMGINSRLKSVPALALGAGGEVVPLEMTSAFGTFANKGIHIKPFSIYRIEDRQGNVVMENRKTVAATDVFSRQTSEMITFCLQGVIDRGTGRAVRKHFKDCDAAGKTGTTDDYADAWFIGYTPELIAGVWIGFDDRRVTFTSKYGYASYAAAPLWGIFMEKVYSDESLPFKKREFSYSVADSTASLTTDEMIIKSLREAKEKKAKEDSIKKSKEKVKFPSLERNN